MRVGDATDDPWDKSDRFFTEHADTENFPVINNYMHTGAPFGVAEVPTDFDDYDIILDPTNADGLIAAMNQRQEEKAFWIFLRNGTYFIDKTIKLAPYVRFVGEDADQVIFDCTPVMSGLAVDLVDGNWGKEIQAGLYNITFTNTFDKADPYRYSNDYPDHRGAYIYFHNDCYGYMIQNCRFLNAGSHSITMWRGRASTIRDCYFEGVLNKGDGGSGYIQLTGDQILFYNNEVKHIRHLVLQREHCKDNTLYRNYLHQDVNFHNADLGNNLVEQNAIVIAQQMPGWNTIMGPWSYKHSNPGDKNYAYNNVGLKIDEHGVAQDQYSERGTVYQVVEHEGNTPIITLNKSPLYPTFYPWRHKIKPTELGVFYPYDGDNVNADDKVKVVAKTDGDFKSLDLYFDGQKVATANTFPYAASIDMTLGAHTLQWKGIDHDDQQHVGEIINVKAVDHAVTFAYPLQGSKLKEGLEFSLRLKHIGDIAQVRFYVDDELVGTTSAKPFLVTLSNTYQRGTHTARVEFYDVSTSEWVDGDEITFAIDEDVSASMGAAPTENILKVWPTMVQDDLNFLCTDDVRLVSIKVYSLEGTIVKTIDDVEGDKINMSDLKAGVYLFELKTESRSYVRRFLKK